MMWAVWEAGSLLIQVQVYCHGLTWTHIVLFHLLLPPIKYSVDLVIFAWDSSVLGSQDAQGASHARKQRNKQLQLWMDASAFCLLWIQWKHAAQLAERRGIVL